MDSQFLLNVFSIVPLFFTIALARKHIWHSRKNVYYIWASVLTILLLLLEILVTMIAAQTDLKYAIWHKLINVIGFTISPIVPYSILRFISTAHHKYGLRSLWILPLYFNVIVSIASLWLKLIFFIDSQNQYFRGELFFIPTIVSTIYFAIIWYEISKNRAKMANMDKMILFVIFLLPVVSTTFQIFYPSVLIIWPSISMALLLYYIHTLELQYDFDTQCHIKNRSAFEKHLKTYEKRKNATLFVFDLNNLKKTNDSHGHAVGDKLILTTAKILNHHFEDRGEVFRIGGDEFCAVCPILDENDSQQIITNIMFEIASADFSLPVKLSLSYGYSEYDVHVHSSITEAFSRADDAMYAHKNHNKLNL